LSIVHNIFIIVQCIASWVLHFNIHRFTKGDNCTTRSENKLILNINNLHHDIGLLISTFNYAYYLVIVLLWICIRQQNILWLNYAMGEWISAMGEWISDCCLTSKWAISFKVFHGKNKLHFNEMMRSALY
jgi:hypothetical protein